MDRKSILEMARGAIQERVDYEMVKVVDNILDINTKAARKRTLTLSIDFVPDDERQTIQIRATAKFKLEPTNPVSTSLYITGDANGEMVAVEMVPQTPGQTMLDGTEQPEPAVLRLIKNA